MTAKQTKLNTSYYVCTENAFCIYVVAVTSSRVELTVLSVDSDHLISISFYL